MDQDVPVKFESFEAGNWIQQYQYKSFDPVTINREWHWEDPVINTLLEKASRALAELDAFTLIVPDVDLFIQMHITKEANTSSRIEGTQTQMDEAVLDDAAQVAPENATTGWRCAIMCRPSTRLLRNWDDCRCQIAC
ncbi:Fic/DOC family N-terminal domain-containing protein [Microbulbifer litoralis]|uniref:Fic/DOC family N-terminal domain-containing protein n=1 Tax=Microbulbifer litoralis TaxID=2933965 RepID=UPI0020291C92|nr:Fic/DOC family N-terminal domain-containing protein [Microbulbifer sp. GX H0434]